MLPPWGRHARGLRVCCLLEYQRFVAFCFDDESTHGLAEMTDTVGLVDAIVTVC